MIQSSKEKKFHVIKEWCKGCGICVEFCPTKVLVIEGDKVYLTDEEKCIKCGLCVMYCPDYAIYIEDV